MIEYACLSLELCVKCRHYASCIRSARKKQNLEVGEAGGIYNKNMLNSFRQHLITGALLASKCDRCSFAFSSSSVVVTYFSLFCIFDFVPFVFAARMPLFVSVYLFRYDLVRTARGYDIFPSGRVSR